MNAPKRISSQFILCLLVALLFIGCKQKQNATTKPVADIDNAQSQPVEDSPQPSPKHLASTPANAVISRNPPLDISKLLRTEDVEQIFDQKQLKTTSLAGQTPSANYNGFRIVIDDTAKPGYGIGLQVWKMADADAANARLEELKSQYLGVQPLPANLQQTDENGFISERGGIRSYLVFTEPASIVGLTCEKTLCANWSDLIKLANVVQSRI